ncbi:MAG: 2-C-methyl-D-erythritol 4-phosphate cytidylyltransferase [Nitrospirae bacterium CG_4_9_14_3_um_filter_53_35]|nr:MAG: 2-C-methyl-D-erythritol 4-phosphate cytidylyltransferase [Nitrospirae bacterium CG_4_10_14_3_um_filter_53_41]PJA73629.1 MAG: 2-C-methyl-D-erythritol 4-phosphate cytidylyltransferase [Nitrospirae bacterium CG_4_9_14_3_um_filter_53_35]
MDRSATPRCAGIVPSAGKGIRMGSSVKKQFLSLCGEPVLVHTLRVLQTCPEMDEIILVVPEEDRAFCREQIVEKYGFDKIVSIISGGRERQDSVYAGLLSMVSPPDLVVVHDGVRPFLTGEMIRESVRLAAQGVSAVAGVPVRDTIKSVDSSLMVTKTLSRETLWSIQTPQAFPYRDLVRAYESAYEDGFLGTDDASLIERLGLPVRVVMGNNENIKITSPLDLVLGEEILKQRLEHADRTRI